MYSYNRSQHDALFLNFVLVYTIGQSPQWAAVPMEEEEDFDIQLYMRQTDLLSIIRSLDTVFTGIGICHTSSVDCLLTDACTVHNTHATQFILCRHSTDNICTTSISTLNHFL